MREKITVCLDPGHGGTQPGASKGDRLEKTDVLLLAQAIRNKLVSAGVNVVMTRNDDTDVGIDDRCEIANDSGAAFFLSVHRNSAATASASGHEIWVHSKSTAEERLYAREILDAAVAVSGRKSRGVKLGAPAYADFGVNSGSNMPSALLELGFISNTGDNADFDSHFAAYAEAIARAIINIVGLPSDTDRIRALEIQITGLTEENEKLKATLEKIRGLIN